MYLPGLKSESKNEKWLEKVQSSLAVSNESWFLRLMTVLVPVMALAVDFPTILSFVLVLFNESVLVARITALPLALGLDGASYFLGEELSRIRVYKRTVSERRIAMAKAGFLTAVTVFSLLLFLFFAVLSSRYSALEAEESQRSGFSYGQTEQQESGQEELQRQKNELILDAGMARALLPLITTMMCFGVGLYGGARQRRIDRLTGKRYMLENRKEGENTVIEKYRNDILQFDCDRQDRELCLLTIRQLRARAEEQVVRLHILLAGELGSAEAAGQLLKKAGIEDAAFWEEAETWVNRGLDFRPETRPAAAPEGTVLPWPVPDYSKTANG